MTIFNKETLTAALLEIAANDWQPITEERNPNNKGTIGNTVEDLLGIEENNLPLPNAAEWELKTYRVKSSSLTTMFHCEPSPRALKFVPQLLLPEFGWAHKDAGGKYDENERSFRQTIFAESPTSRGFSLFDDRENDKLEVRFNPDDIREIDESHSQWKLVVEDKSLDPAPYWGFDDLTAIIGTKLHNCFYIGVEVRNKDTEFRVSVIRRLQGIRKGRVREAISEGLIAVDFDARTGHNHGTKFRIKNGRLYALYDTNIELFSL